MISFVGGKKMAGEIDSSRAMASLVDSILNEIVLSWILKRFGRFFDKPV